MPLTHGDSFDFNGFTFRVMFESDETSDAPWDNSDGHGPVSAWRDLESKEPGERVLTTSRGNKATFYDFAEATRIAKRDKWGLGEPDLAKLTAQLGRKPTPKEIARQAVENDFEFLRAWCNDEWQYIGVIVSLEHDSDLTASLWGIESNAGDYLDEVANELAEQVLSENGLDAR